MTNRKYAWQRIGDTATQTEARRQDLLIDWRAEHPGQPDPDNDGLQAWLASDEGKDFYRLADRTEVYLIKMMLEGGHLKDKGYIEDEKVVRRPSPEVFRDAYESLMSEIRAEYEDNPKKQEQLEAILRKEGSH